MHDDSVVHKSSGRSSVLSSKSDRDESEIRRLTGNLEEIEETGADACTIECSPDVWDVQVPEQDSNGCQPDIPSNPESPDRSRSTTFSCPLCKFTSRLARALYQHLRSHVNSNVPDCPLCKAQFDDVESLVEHMVVHKEKRFYCIYCNQVFPKFGTLKIHMATHKEQANFKCKKCNFNTHTRRNLLAHAKRFHSKHYRCPSCEYKTGSKERLEAHRLVHDDEKRYACASCDYEAKWENSLKRHVTEHHSSGDAYPCPLCDKKFSALHQLKVHAEKHSLPPPDFLKIT